MSDATGTVTTNYGFKTLDDGDRAGYAGINELIESVDDNIPLASGMVMLMLGATAPTGWTNINSTIVGLQATLSLTGYIWIKKS
jgi:hypothetical protein